jgi:hypothetical protein
MNPTATIALYTSTIIPRDYKRYAVVSWNSNLTGFTEAELYGSISYSQQTYTTVTSGWLKSITGLPPAANQVWNGPTSNATGWNSSTVLDWGSNYAYWAST